MYEYKATIVSVYDGDTITVDMDFGCDLHRKKMKLRMYGINAPELYDGTPDGMAARNYLREMLVIGKTYRCETLKDKQEKYGRYLIVMYTDTGESINQMMVSAGHAVPYMIGQ